MIFDQSGTRIRPGTRVDRGGNTVADWSDDAVSLLAVDRVSIQPASQTERVDETRDVAVSGWRVYSEPGTAPDVQFGDRFRHGVITCDVVGEVARWPDPLSGGVHHIEFSIQRARG